jgi:tetratricopeptide (TPR) repeat protein
LFLIRQGELPAARSALTNAVHVDEKALGPAASQTLADLAELAAISESSLAEPMWRRASASSDAAVAARSFGALGQIREQAQDRTGAAALYRQALAKEEAATGRQSVRFAARLNSLSLVVDSKEAIALLERALRISTARVGLGRVETASIQMNLASQLLRASQTGRAAQLAKDAAMTFEQVLGAEHPRAAASRSLAEQADAARKDATKKR